MLWSGLYKEQELFDIFSMLTDIEDAFRSMKSGLGLRPIYHQKEHRADGHLFITVLAYHILHTIRFKLRQNGITHSWPTIRKELVTHARISATIKRDDGKIIHIRKASRPEPFHVQIYNGLNLPLEPEKRLKQSCDTYQHVAPKRNIGAMLVPNYTRKYFYDHELGVRSNYISFHLHRCCRKERSRVFNPHTACFKG